MSIPTLFSIFVKCNIEFTSPALPLFSIDWFIFLYKLSTNNGTASIAVGFASCISGTIYLRPPQIATDEPFANGNKAPIDDSYVWCNGNTEKNLSLSYIFTYFETAFTFSAKFLWHNITPFACDVVPEVNIKNLNSSGSISTSIYSVFPASVNFLPSAITFSIPTSLPCTGSSLFISIKYFTIGKLSFILSIASFFFFE